MTEALSTSRDGPAALSQAEIQISPEMVEAGVSCLEEFSESYPAAELVRAIYSAMALADRQ